MSRFYLPVALLILTALACHRAEPFEREALAAKAEPYDLFAFQRSYPDPAFDWQGWRKALQRARAETSAAEDRGPGGCGGNATDWTLQGPANVGGRVNALAVKPGDDLTVLAGFAGGG